MKNTVRTVIDYLIAILTLPLLAVVIKPSSYDMELWVICAMAAVIAYVIYFAVVYRMTRREINKRYTLDKYTERSFLRTKKFLKEKNDKELLEKWSIATNLFIGVRIMMAMVLVTIGVILYMDI